MLDAELLDEAGREDAARKGAAEDVAEFVVETADAHVLEAEVGRDDRVGGPAVPSVGPERCAADRFALDLSLIALPLALVNVIAVVEASTPMRSDWSARPGRYDTPGAPAP